MIICVAGVVACHLADARSRGESLWPVLLGLGLVALILSAAIALAVVGAIVQAVFSP